jgi:hypothetical protein
LEILKNTGKNKIKNNNERGLSKVSSVMHIFNAILSVLQGLFGLAEMHLGF